MKKKKYVYVVGIAVKRSYVVIDTDEPAAEEDPWNWTSSLGFVENFPKGIFTDYERAVKYYEHLKKRDLGVGNSWEYNEAYICKIELNVWGGNVQDLLETHHDERF